MRARIWLIGMAGLTAAGCFKLDSFLYDTQRTDHYVFEPDGGTPQTTVSTVRIEPVSIVVDSQVTLGAVYVHATQPPPRAFALYFHGNGGTLDDSFDRIKWLSNLGYDVLAIDYRGFGTSSNVAPTEAGLDADGHAAYEFLVGRAGSAARIFYYGRSFGTAVATQRAVGDPPAALILESAFASVEDFKNNSSQMDLPSGYVAKDGWDTVGRMKALSAPLLLLHGLEDTYVRPEFSEELAASANVPKELILVPHADHSDVPQMMDANVDGGYAGAVNPWIGRFVP